MFSLSVAQSLVQLWYLKVSFCQNIKEIFKKEDGELMEISQIELPKLSFISFYNMNSFCRLCNGIDRIELPELRCLSLGNLPSIKMSEGGDNNEVHQQYLIPKVSLCIIIHFICIKISFSPEFIYFKNHSLSLQFRACMVIRLQRSAPTFVYFKF